MTLRVASTEFTTWLVTALAIWLLFGCARTEPVYQPDGIHLLDVGRKIVARDISRTMKERLLSAAPRSHPRGWVALHPPRSPHPKIHSN